MFTKVSFKVHTVDNSKISNEGLFCNCNHRFKIKTNNENIYFKVTNIIRYPCKGWWRILDGLSRHRLQRKSVFGSSGEKARVGLCLCPPIAPCVISTVHAVLLPPGKDACPSPGYWRLLLSSPRESILMRSFFRRNIFCSKCSKSMWESKLANVLHYHFYAFMREFRRILPQIELQCLFM